MIDLEYSKINCGSQPVDESVAWGRTSRLQTTINFTIWSHIAQTRP